MLFWLLCLFFILIEAFIYLYGNKEEEVACDYILVLGAKINKDQVCAALQRRLDKALLYASKYPHIPIIVSGKGSEELSEAEVMKRYLLSKGIDEKRIIKEEKSLTTYTNFLYTKELLESANYKMLVVTCDFHMYRSIALGKRAGFTCYRWPAKSNGLKSIKSYIREFFCVLYFWVKKQ